MMSMASYEKKNQQAPAMAAQRRTAAAMGAVAGPIAQLAGEVNASPRVQSLAQLQQNIQRSPRIQRQSGMSSDFSVLPQSDRSFDAPLNGSAGLTADSSGASSDACGCDAESEAPEPVKGKPREEKVQAKPKGDEIQTKPKEEKIQGKAEEEKLQAKPKEEKIQGKAKDELRQRRAEDAASSSDAGREASASSGSGLPPQLKSGVESLSGMSMDHVQVHYNSDKPAQLNALAYAQGSDIHVGPGQEQHLPHEAWHVVQQAQGRVQATKQLKDGVAINDDKGLEHEADAMGLKAMQRASFEKNKPAQKVSAAIDNEPLQNRIANGNTVKQLFTYQAGTVRDVTVKGKNKSVSFEECSYNSVEYKKNDPKNDEGTGTGTADWAGWLTSNSTKNNATQMHVVNRRWGGKGGAKDGNIFPGSPAENSHHLHEAEHKFDEVCFGGTSGKTAIANCKYECSATPVYGQTVDVSNGDKAVADAKVSVTITNFDDGSTAVLPVKNGDGMTFEDGS